MAGTFRFELVSPERVLMAVDATEVIVPGSEGQFTVLAGHAPVIATLMPGVLHVAGPGGRKAIFVKGGFCEVSPDALTVLAETAFITDEVDRAHVEAEIEAARKALDAANDDEARLHITRAIEELKALTTGGSTRH